MSISRGRSFVFPPLPLLCHRYNVRVRPGSPGSPARKKGRKKEFLETRFPRRWDSPSTRNTREQVRTRRRGPLSRGLSSLVTSHFLPFLDAGEGRFRSLSRRFEDNYASHEHSNETRPLERATASSSNPEIRNFVNPVNRESKACCCSRGLDATSLPHPRPSRPPSLLVSPLFSPFTLPLPLPRLLLSKGYELTTTTTTTSKSTSMIFLTTNATTVLPDAPLVTRETSSERAYSLHERRSSPPRGRTTTEECFSRFLSRIHRPTHRHCDPSSRVRTTRLGIDHLIEKRASC